jgi:methionyl-tRNA formyltransferase
MSKSLRIVFMGTPEFAVPMLDTLVHSQHQVVGVITAPDKPAGRGMQFQQSDVKKYAVEKGLHILQPEKLKNEAFLEELRALQADLFVVVAFRMLPVVVWNMPPLGTINLHASLLPNYRGAAPINWAVINGEKETGVSTFRLQHEIDTGNIIFREKITIDEKDNVGIVYKKLMDIGAPVLLKTVNAMADGNFPQEPQAHITEIKHAPKIFKEHCSIDWSQSAETVYNLIRGLSPYPAAFTTLNGKGLKIFTSQKVNVAASKLPGTVETDGKTYLRFYCKEGAIDCLELQLEGKKRMGVEEFLRGNKMLTE